MVVVVVVEADDPEYGGDSGSDGGSMCGWL